MDSIKNDGSPRDFDRLYRFSLTNIMTAVAIAAAKPVKNTGQIQSVAPLDTIGIRQEIAWVTTVLAANAALIGKFVALRNEFGMALSKGQYDEAGVCLDKVDRECGYSLWAVENRISIAALTGGFERQKAYVNSILSSDRRTFIAFYASNIGERNESRVSRFSFETRLRERAKTWNIKSDQQTYIYFKLVSSSSLTPIEAADILSFEAASSAIDLYETFLNVMVITKDPSSRGHSQVLSHLKKLDRISDHCLDNLRLLYGEDISASVDVAEYLNEFLSGHYVRAASLVETGLLEQPDDPLLILVAARLNALGYSVPAHGNHFVEHILSLLGSFLEQGKGSDEAAQSLERIALNYQSLPISSSIDNLIHHASTDLIGDIPAAAAMRSRCTYLPIRLSLLDESRREKLLGGNAEVQDATWQYETGAQLGMAAIDGALSLEAKSYAAIGFSKKEGRPSRAFPHLEELANSENPYFRQESAILKAWYLHDDGDIYGAILHTVRSAISRPTLLRSLPLVKLFEHRGFRDLKLLEREPCLSIGFFLYANLTRESTKDVALKVAWKQFHKVHRLTKPSELRARFAEFDRDEILFFLRNVCTQEIMELSAAFNSPGDLDTERLQICIALSELDSDRSSDYDAEIIELTRRLSIEDGVQQVESSRVYVDLVGLQRWCHQNLNELFFRYMDYAGAGLEASKEELERSIILIIKKTGVDTAFLSFLDAYDISADSLLAELIEECAAHFLTLPRFGLDAFLGSRVRHGSLEGAFRSPLEARKLITKIDSSTNHYESNSYWLNADDSMSTAQHAALNKALNTFSANIDSLLDTAISRFVHVRSAVYADGLIWLWPSNEKGRRQLLTKWLIQAKAGLSKEVTIEQFVEYCATALFWPNLKASLSEAAQFVTTTLTGQIKEQLDSLAVAAHKATPNHGGLSACISAARGDIDGAAVKVSKWFAPPQFTDVDSSYLLKTGIEIGLTSLRHLRPQFTSDVEWDIDDRANVLLHSAGFQMINDVAFLIFGNIQKHSGFFDGYSTREKPKIKIWLRWNDPNVIEVEVQNEISSAKDIVSIETNVNSAKEQIRLGQFDTVARQRNKTGLVRLASVLNYENSDDKVVDFGVVDCTRFRVKFSVPVFLLTGQCK
ncbi:MAG: hypothetical protein Q8S20_01635 [Sulfuritalea sp.]|nr:hypothetical protein [Sulfuritalea sp.]